MSFDAGEIIAKLRLDRTEFNALLDEEKAKVEETFGKPIDVTVKPELDNRAVADVLVEEEPLRADIEPEVKPTYKKAEAEAVGRAIASDILSGVGGAGSKKGSGGAEESGIGVMISRMLAQGLNKADIADALANPKFGFTGKEIKAALGNALVSELSSAGGGGSDKALASSIAKAMLPSAEEMQVALEDAFYSMIGSGSPSDKSGSNWALSLLGNIARDSSGAQAALGAGGLAGGGHGTGWSIPGENLPVPFIETVGRDITGSLGSSSGDSGGSWLSSLLSRAGSGGSSGLGQLGDLIGRFPALGPLPGGAAGIGILAGGASVGSALLQALGIAGGGAIAGTAIGGLGTVMGAIPGIEDLYKGYGAYSAQKSGSPIPAGTTAGQLALGGQLGKLFSAANPSDIAAKILPQVSKFVGALTQAIPDFQQFGVAATNALGGFFGSIEKGMSGGGFKSFMKEMASLVGPIMTQFGKVIINLLSGLAPLLLVFGQIAATQVGPWFVRVSKEFVKWAQHVKVSKPDIDAMVKTFHSLGSILGALIRLFAAAVRALAPVGVLLLRLASHILVPLINQITLLINGLVKLVSWFMKLSFVQTVIHWLKSLWQNLQSLHTSAFSLGNMWHTVWTGIRSVVESVWGKIKPILDKLKQALSDVLGPLGKVAGFVGKVGGGIVSGVGGFFSHIIPHAAGGSVSPGQTYLVGENGPELFASTVSGTIIPNGQFGGGTQLVFQIDARGNPDPQSMERAVRQGALSAIPALQAALSRGAS